MTAPLDKALIDDAYEAWRLAKKRDFSFDDFSAFEAGMRALSHLKTAQAAPIEWVDKAHALAKAVETCTSFEGLHLAAFELAEHVKTAQAAPIVEPRPHTVTEAMLQALRFYARGEHFTVDDDEFDTVSGEPQNWLCHSDDPTMIEDGTIARKALLGEPLSWIDGDDDATPQPIEGELLATPVQAAPIVEPAGWKLVPLEPTPEMLEQIRFMDKVTDVAMTVRYRAMLDAAPLQPAAQPPTDAAKELRDALQAFVEPAYEGGLDNDAALIARGRAALAKYDAAMKRRHK